jgi:histidinol-phosphate aminotransferase
MKDDDETRSRVERWVRPGIRAMRAYQVHGAEGLIKLDAMENPYPFPRWMLEQWLATLRHVSLNRYPDASATKLKQCLADLYQVPEGYPLVLGNGSDELIQMLALAMGGEGRTILAPEPTFVMYKVIAATVGMNYIGVPLRTDFALDVDAMLAVIDEHSPALVFLAHPNNPTGNLFDDEAIGRIIEAAPGLVVVDEAYFSFARRTWLPELERRPNLIVMRTLSKMGLAGLRMGWMAGHPQWMDQVEKVRLPYNIGSLTQASTEFALAHVELFDEQTRSIVGEREHLAGRLRVLPGIEVFPSAANFILFRVPNGDADRVFEALKEAGILIKNLDAAGGTLSGCLRVTAGTAAETQAFMAALTRCWTGS